MTTVAETRLAAYLAAEAAILQAQEARVGDRTHRMAELEAVQKQINLLQRQVTREQARAAGQGGLNFAVADLSGNP
jgi:chemotaxis receptor (MCP) glutamine deamidase CheD